MMPADEIRAIAAAWIRPLDWTCFELSSNPNASFVAWMNERWQDVADGLGLTLEEVTISRSLLTDRYELACIAHAQRMLR